MELGNRCSAMCCLGKMFHRSLLLSKASLAKSQLASRPEVNQQLWADIVSNVGLSDSCSSHGIVNRLLSPDAFPPSLGTSLV